MTVLRYFDSKSDLFENISGKPYMLHYDFHFDRDEMVLFYSHKISLNGSNKKMLRICSYVILLDSISEHFYLCRVSNFSYLCLSFHKNSDRNTKKKCKKNYSLA